jgi:hypothetical protein
MLIIKNGLNLKEVYNCVSPILEDTKLEVIRKLILILPEEIIFDMCITKDSPNHGYDNITITTMYHGTNDFRPYLSKIKDSFITDHRNITSSKDGYKFHQMVFRDGTSIPDVGSIIDNTYSWHIYQEQTEIELFIMRSPDKTFIEKLL